MAERAAWDIIDMSVTEGWYQEATSDPALVEGTKQGTYAREHMGDWARNLDAEQPGHTEQEAEDTRHDAAPHEHLGVPFRGADELREARELALEEDERPEKERRAKVLPVRKLDRRVSGVRKRVLDEDGVYRDEERR